MKRLKKIYIAAKEKGFNSGFLPSISDMDSVGEPSQYIVLCEMQKWLRDDHNIRALVIPTASYSAYAGCKSDQFTEPNTIQIYEEALLTAVEKGLEFLNQ